jgi:hypothetical protein
MSGYAKEWVERPTPFFRQKLYMLYLDQSILRGKPKHGINVVQVRERSRVFDDFLKFTERSYSFCVTARIKGCHLQSRPRTALATSI